MLVFPSIVLLSGTIGFLARRGNSSSGGAGVRQLAVLCWQIWQSSFCDGLLGDSGDEGCLSNEANGRVLHVRDRRMAFAG